ncbi:CD48 antigen [Labeo rohita]|uniref:CD48 antigen n=1 Tax=Labeo rohita TaxID=84645 RepID=A0ABQ8LJE5_LABRO|nr:CD48 antigen [Labeo rohita]
MEGDSVTLQSGLNKTENGDLITWTFGDPGVHIARINVAAKQFNTCDDVLDGKFRARLKLDHQTGSLTITNTRTTDSGLYNKTIRRSNVITYKFNVTVYGE